MKNQNFAFTNQSPLDSPKQNPPFNRGPQYQYYVLSTFLLLSLFSTPLLFGIYGSQKNKALKLLTASQKKAHTVPLLLNLKSHQGPRLARVQVLINFQPSADFSKQQELEKQLLFLLSGQALQDLTKKKFQSQIQKQLNAFLRGSLVQDLNINLEVLN